MRMSRRSPAGMLAAALAACTGWAGAEAMDDHVVRIGAEALLEDHPRSHFVRRINNAPVSGETVGLNPPRFRWSYDPAGKGSGLWEFRFQIAAAADFAKPIVDVRTPYNFYNALAPLDGAGPFSWRVGYVRPGAAGGPKVQTWSPARPFRIAPGARVWDRSGFARPAFADRPHPRILLSEANRKKILRLIETDADSRAVFEALRRRADAVLRAGWYRDFPASDARPAGRPFHYMAAELCGVACMWRLTGQRKYASVIERAVTLAGYPKGGRSSPEPMGESNEDSTQVTEFLALMYDWLWPELGAAQRKAFVASLDWRIDHFVNNFAWRRRSREGGFRVARNWSLATEPGSHQFEGFWDTFPAALACHEDSPAARQCFELGVNWLVGVTCGHGFDEGWNEGPGYANSKFNWLMHAVTYLDSVFPEFGLPAHPWFDRIGEWFCRITPVGIKHAPWGHGSNRSSYWLRGRAGTFRPLAYLTGNGVFLRNWAEITGRDVTRTGRLWIQLALPALHRKPRERVETDPVGLFPLAGWVMAGTKPPSSPACYAESVGMIFQCRPAGAYSHSFAGENSFHLYGYGEDLSHAAGTSGTEPHAFHSMSHNTVLIDGLGQTQAEWPDTPRLGFLRAFQRGDGYVYWAGDATGAYPKDRTRAGGWWGRLDPIYTRRDAGHLRRFIRHVIFLRGKSFVIFDDLAAAKPAKFSWLYHVLPAEPFRLDPKSATIDYQVGKVPVRIVHAAGRDGLEWLDMKGPEGFKNPLTGEDYTEDLGRSRSRRPRKAALIAGHNLYVSNKTPAKEWSFLCVIAPARPGDKPTRVERLDDRTVRVGADVVTFDARSPHKADFVIDAAALRAAPPKPSWYVAPSEP